MKGPKLDEIIANWDVYRDWDWYAIDAYNPGDGRARRVFVGCLEDAAALMRDTYAVPTDLALQSYHRCALVSSEDAWAYFSGETELPDERGVYSVTEAAGMLGVSRQRVHQLIEAGRIDARKVGNAWEVYRHSIENRMA